MSNHHAEISKDLTSSYAGVSVDCPVEIEQKIRELGEEKEQPPLTDGFASTQLEMLKLEDKSESKEREGIRGRKRQEGKREEKLDGIVGRPGGKTNGRSLN